MASKARVVAAQALYDRAKELGLKLKVEGKRIYTLPAGVNCPKELRDALLDHIREIKQILVDEALAAPQSIPANADDFDAEKDGLEEGEEPEPEWALTEKYKRFARFYVRSLNRVYAYGKAGFRANKDSAAVCACRLLKNVKVQAYIAELQAKAAEPVEAESFLTIAEKRAFLAQVVRTPVGEVDQHHPLCQEHSVTDKGEKFKMPDKTKAIELDSKLAGDFKEKPMVVEAGDSLTSLLVGLRRKKQPEKEPA